MEKDRISEFLESINSEKWNCVYQANGMTLLTSKEYDYRYKEIVSLKTQLKKQKEIIDNAINFINTPWSFESGNEKVDEIIHQKKIELIKLLKDVVEE